jgi:dihydroxy-acid dehydratase
MIFCRHLESLENAKRVRETQGISYSRLLTTLQNTPEIMSSSQDESVPLPATAASNPDYDLSIPINPNGVGLRQKLTSYGDAHFSLFMRKLFIKAMGYSEDALSRPIVGIVNTYSSFNPCHANIPQLIDAVKRGVQLSGGLAIDFPTISLHESFAAPTSMFLRNLMSMDTEEMIRAQPVDSVILIGGETCSRILVHNFHTP